MAEDRVLTENGCDGKERKVGGQNLEKESHRKRRRELSRVDLEESELDGPFAP